MRGWTSCCADRPTMLPSLSRRLASLMLLALTVAAPTARAESHFIRHEHSPVVRAIEDGDLPALRAALAQGEPRNRPGSAPNNSRQSPLMVACGWGRPDAAQVLLEAGADPSVTVPRHSNHWPPVGWSALCFARWKNLTDIEGRLIAAGAPPEPVCLREADFLAAVQKRDVEEVSRQVQRSHGRLPANVTHYAVGFALAHHDAGLMREVLRVGRPAAPDRDGRTRGDGWMDKAFLYDDVATMGVLMDAGVKPPPVAELAEKGHTGLLARALKAGTSPDAEDADGRETLLSAAARNGHVDAVRLLLKAGADPNKKATSGQLPLLHAVGRNPYKPEDTSITQLLLDAGADVRTPQAGSHLLQAAAGSCSPKTVALLLKRKVPWRNTPARGAGPYSSALRNRNFCPEEETVRVLQALRSGGVRIRADDDADWTFLWRQAKQHPAFERELTQAGMPPSPDSDFR
ncbi:hypothetical protein D7X12_02935 [Corallococcus sicarius]|uniref:Ankyrin repeat domain-containing protein n=2 Tax=Corallococcus sicarius TaxID=2316726 RepID=A0A3A8P6N7_9BACT|nr:hypothetical protein D7X12_02935 [Corallococcus sicarius]